MIKIYDSATFSYYMISLWNPLRLIKNLDASFQQLHTGIPHYWALLYCTSHILCVCVCVLTNKRFVRPCVDHVGAIFQQLSLTLCHSGNSHISNFSLLYLLWKSVIFDAANVIVLGCCKPHPHKLTKVIHKCCVCLTGHPSQLSSLLGPLYSLGQYRN